MSNDLISRSELLKALDAFSDISSAFCKGIEIARKIIEEQPAADEDERKMIMLKGYKG